MVETKGSALTKHDAYGYVSDQLMYKTMSKLTYNRSQSMRRDSFSDRNGEWGNECFKSAFGCVKSDGDRYQGV